MSNIAQPEFRDPPTRAGGTRGPAATGIWIDLLTPLVHHPGKWAMVRTADDAQKASGMAASLRKENAKIPAGKWEFAARQGEVFARYIGPE